MDGLNELFTHSGRSRPGSEGCGSGRQQPETTITHHAPGARRETVRGRRRGGAEWRATLRALGEVQTRSASLAPSPPGSMTPHWLAGRGGVD